VSTASRCTRFVAVLSAAVLTTGLLLVGIAAPPALAASGSVPVRGTVGLYGVSCPSATKCFAVGELQQPGTIRGAMVTVTSGHASSPKLVSAANGLYGISCTSATNCYAVGFNNLADGEVVHFAGATQSSFAVPVVDSFTGVACVSATLCYAVGTEHNKKGTVVVTISNNRVTRTKIAPKLGLPEGIACHVGGSCVVVGGGIALIGGGPGTALTLSHGTPGTPRSTKTNFFEGVACASATTCYAGASAGTAGVVVSLKGGVPGAVHEVVSTSQLGAVACANATTCLAVGALYGSSGSPHGALVKLTKGVPGKATLSGPANFNAVSCHPSGLCVAVGTNNDMTQGYLVALKI
jgi:hypothetical protein